MSQNLNFAGPNHCNMHTEKIVAVSVFGFALSRELLLEADPPANCPATCNRRPRSAPPPFGRGCRRPLEATN